MTDQTPTPTLDESFIRRCLTLAQEAEAMGEVPIGALIVDRSGDIVAEAFNRREIDRSPIAHAELLAIKMASEKLNRWRLLDCTLYVTLEPCSMCAGAIVLSRIERIVYGAKDPKAGAIDSVYKLVSDPRLNHRAIITSGVLERECGAILSRFFEKKRARSR